MSKPTTHARPKLVVTLSNKGGVGTTTLATTIFDLMDLAGQTPLVVQLDDQTRLQQTIGRSVISLDTHSIRASRTDPSAGLKIFRPLLEALERAIADQSTVLLDIGATQGSAFTTFASLAELDEELVAEGISSMLFTVGVAEPESIRQATKTLQQFKQVLPSTRRTFVENRRDGALSEANLAGDALECFNSQLRPMVESGHAIVMPAVEGGSWRYFERHFCRPMDVIGWDISRVAALTGLPKVEAKIVRGDIAAWFSAMEEALAPVLGLEVANV